MTGKVTVGLASDWPSVRHFCGLSTYEHPACTHYGTWNTLPYLVNKAIIPGIENEE